MNWQVIISQNENLNEVYRNFGNDLSKYLDRMKGDVSDINAAVASLGNFWKSDDYNDFKNAMTAAMNKMSVSLQRGQELRGQMNEAQKQLAIGLDKLRTKYGG